MYVHPNVHANLQLSASCGTHTSLHKDFHSAVLFLLCCANPSLLPSCTASSLSEVGTRNFRKIQGQDLNNASPAFAFMKKK